MELILFGRADCHLCDRLEALLEPHLRAGGHTLVKRCIDEDAELRLRYRYRIPVLVHDGRVLLEGRPDPRQVAQVFADL